MTMKKIITLVLLAILASPLAHAQYESDTESIDSILEALYASISGDAGEERDWDRFRNLFIEGAKLTPTFQNQQGQVGFIQWSPDEYIERAGASLERDGFHEDEIHREVDTYRYITQVFSTYQSKRTKDGEVFARGINSIQLFNDGNRWWVVSIFWSSENEEYPVPSEYLEGEWTSLFDGESLDGWVASENEGTFTIENGIIKVQGDRSHLFYNGSVGNANFTDFEFKAKVMTENNSNSGIYFHTKFQESGWPIHGYEAQVNNSYNVDPRRSGSLYGVDDNEEITFPDEEWMDYYIKVEGKHIVIKINGDIISEFTEGDDVEGFRRLSSGTIALQGHDPKSTVYYKDIYIREL